MEREKTMRIIGTGVLAAFILCVAAATEVRAVEVDVSVDTPWSFRATFTALDTDPYTIEGGDFGAFTFDFWSLVVHMRGDEVDPDGNLVGFYEIQLRRTGHKAPDPDAPVVKTFNVKYGPLQPDATLTEFTVSSGPNGEGSDYLSTTVNILFDNAAGVVLFSGSIAGDVDLDGDGEIDVPTTDKAVETLRSLRDVGIITGNEMGQIIRQTRQPLKK
jgi:hypothetical protein